MLVAERSGLKRRLARLSASPNALPEQEYRFLVGRFIDSATLARATAIAAQWGVHPHEVMIANGWLGAEDYYRALAEACGTPFKTELTPRDVTPAAGAGPRRSLASGLLKERAPRGVSCWRQIAFAPTRFARCSRGLSPTTSRSLRRSRFAALSVANSPRPSPAAPSRVLPRGIPIGAHGNGRLCGSASASRSAH